MATISGQRMRFTSELFGKGSDVDASDKSERDKLSTARHEAGHAVVAAMLGALHRCWIEPTGTSNPELESYWKGRTEIRRKLNKAEWGALGFAGELSEFLCEEVLCCENEDDAPEVVDFLEYWQLSVIEPSDSDRSLTPESETDQLDSAELAWSILITQRPLFEKIVSELLKSEVLTDDRIQDFKRDLAV